jgi:hypothetical protein
MVGIYQDDFIEYLKERLGDNIKVTAKNIIVPCPFCEYPKEKSHYHMYLSLEAPIFHCFKAECEASGTVRKLLKKIEGSDISDKFIDQSKLQEFKQKREVFVDAKSLKHQILLPPLKIYRFQNKELYLKKRLKFMNVPSEHIKGLVYDVDEFININKVPVDQSLFRLREYLQNNFIGFLTENQTTVIFRNIDHSHAMRYYKLKIQDDLFLDYYKLPGNNPKSRKIVLAEGIFDIFSEHIFDYLNIKNDVKLYASALSSKYVSLIHSIIFNEQIFKPDVYILSDRGVSNRYYEKIKKYNGYLFNKIEVYYNKAGKDFNESPVIPTKYVLC